MDLFLEERLLTVRGGGELVWTTHTWEAVGQQLRMEVQQIGSSPPLVRDTGLSSKAREGCA